MIKSLIFYRNKYDIVEMMESFKWRYQKQCTIDKRYAGILYHVCMQNAFFIFFNACTTTALWLSLVVKVSNKVQYFVLHLYVIENFRYTYFFYICDSISNVKLKFFLMIVLGLTEMNIEVQNVM